MVKVGHAIVPGAVGAGNSALGVIEVDDGEAVNVTAGEAEGIGSDTGLAVEVAVEAGEGAVHCVLAGWASCVADCCAVV